MNKEIIKPIEINLREFQKRFSSVLKSKITLLDIILKYILKQKGKKIRPILVLLSAKLVGGVNDRTYTAAILVELLHTATLVHDDVVDDAKVRRGIASINAIWKNKAAVLIGDYLLSKGLLFSLENNEYEFLKILSEAVKRMSEGELMQIQRARKFDATERTYFEVISNKTASLIKTCCKLGAFSATDNEDYINSLSAFGENLGIAFQLRDDLLDYMGRKKLLGKSIGNDIKEKKFTLPLLYSLNHAPQKISYEIIKLIKSNSLKKFNAVYDFINNYGGIEHTNKKTKYYCELAKENLKIFKNSDAKIALNSLIDFIYKREY